MKEFFLLFVPIRKVLIGILYNNVVDLKLFCYIVMAHQCIIWRGYLIIQ